MREREREREKGKTKKREKEEKSQFLLARSTQYHMPEKGTCTHAPARKLQSTCV